MPRSARQPHSFPRLTVGADGVLTGVSPQLLALLKGRLTVDNPKYLDAKKYGRWLGKRLQPQLRFYEDVEDGLRFPRGFAKQAVQLCRRSLGATPEIIDYRRQLPPVDFGFQGELRPYQAAALQDILARDFGVLEAGTGSGKTVVALAVIARRRQPTLILVHTKELLHQWAERIRTFLGQEPGLLGDGHQEVRPVTVAIVNSARRRLEELPARFGHLCVDECHRVPATLFTEVVRAFDCRYSLGLSATAFRRDGLTALIYYYLGDRVHRVDTAELHSSGAVLRPQLCQRLTEFTYRYRGDYQALLSALTRNEARNRQIAVDIREELRQGAGALLVVSDRVAHCEQLAALLAGGDYAVAVLTGKLNNEERSRIVAAIRQDELNVLISTVQLIGEGFDCPGLHTLFLTTPIKFTGRLQQVVGRILRPAAGKQPKVYDYVDPVGVLQKSAASRRLLFSPLAGEGR